MPEITLLFVALLALLQLVLTLAVGLRRRQTGISFLDGGDDTLLRRMRGHNNFTETVPIALLAMGGAEILGIPGYLVWAGGVCILVGRLAHYHVMLTRDAGAIRFAIMLVTLFPIGGFAVGILLAL